MVDFSGEFRRCLDTLDVADMRRLWANHSPHLPQPNDAQCLATMHLARTEAQSIDFHKRAYSHAWLAERGLPSKLPDHLRPTAQQMFPVVAKAVGISVKAASEHGKKAAVEIQSAMEDAVKESVEDGRFDDVAHVKRRIDAARKKAIDRLFG